MRKKEKINKKSLNINSIKSKLLSVFLITTVILFNSYDSFAMVQEEKNKLSSIEKDIILTLKEENQKTVTDVCEFIKKNNKEIKFAGCGISGNHNCEGISNIDGFYNQIDNCLDKTKDKSNLSCSDLFEYHASGSNYKVGKKSQKYELDVIKMKIPEEKKVSHDIIFNSSRFCKWNTIKISYSIPKFLENLQTIGLTKEEAKLYANESFIRKCADELMGDKIKSFCEF